MSKKEFIKLAYSLGFDSEYDGHTRTMYLYAQNGQPWNNTEAILSCTVDFMIVFNH